MKVIAFIPVRGGSKSIPLKNIKPLCGKPLVCWNIEALEACPQADKVIVATDSDEIWKTVESRDYNKTKLYRRSAENACVEIERFLGNDAKDISMQNLGYDVESTMPDGRKRYIEVKSVSRSDSSFSLTNNEYTAAHQYGDDYYICLIKHGDDNSKAIYIQNPLEKLKLEKRIRQWEWYCEEYQGDEIDIEY